jgi:hypothetical protein
MATHKVLYQEWAWRDSWEGPSAADGALHLTEEDRLAYVRARRGPLLEETPDIYEIPSSTAVWVEIDEALYKRVVASKPGLRVKAKTKTSFQPVSS